MRLLLYKDLDIRRVKAAFAKTRAFIEAGDFRSADVKKLAPTRYCRAKLDRARPPSRWPSCARPKVGCST